MTRDDGPNPLINRRLFLASLGGMTAIAIGAISTRRSRTYESAHARPTEVILMRHAEEPPRGPHLSEQGMARANALPGFFIARGLPPTALFAARSTRSSSRPVETLDPLAAALGLRIDDSCGDEQYAKLADLIRSRRDYAGGHIVVCWHHGTIANLAAALDVVRPPAWPVMQYDHIWQIRYDRGHAVLTDEPEHLLPGDGDAPAADVQAGSRTISGLHS